MKVSDFVRIRGRTGFILEMANDDRFGKTAKVLFNDGTVSEWERRIIEIRYPLKGGGIGIIPSTHNYGLQYFNRTGYVCRENGCRLVCDHRGDW
jgi:hypothetical protein